MPHRARAKARAKEEVGSWKALLFNTSGASAGDMQEFLGEAFKMIWKISIINKGRIRNYCVSINVTLCHSLTGRAWGYTGAKEFEQVFDIPFS